MKPKKAKENNLPAEFGVENLSDESNWVEAPMTDDTILRPWERHWSEGMVNKNFLRYGTQMSHPSRDVIADYAAKYDTVLECGCATAIDYPRHVERGTAYTGIDLTKDFVIQARELNPGIDVRRASMLAIPFEDRSHDTVYCRAVIEHMHPLEWPFGVKEMWRVADKQMILAFFNWRVDRSPRPLKGGGIRDSIIKRIERDQANRAGKRMAGPTSVFNRSIPEPDILDVIKWVGGENWVKKEVGGPNIVIRSDGVEVKQRTGWKRYYIYIVEK